MAYPKSYLYRRIVLAKLYIDTNYAENINLDLVAGEAHFSKFHFIRLFKQAYGKTPHQYLIKLRLEKARHLLGTGFGVSEVCGLVGFESISSFSGLFKKHVGMLPSAYQRQQKRAMQDMAQAPLKFIPYCFSGRKGENKNRNFQEASV